MTEPRDAKTPDLDAPLARLAEALDERHRAQDEIVRGLRPPAGLSPPKLIDRVRGIDPAIFLRAPALPPTTPALADLIQPSATPEATMTPEPALAKTYDPHAIEQARYARWEAAGHFKPQGRDAPYCIMLPPPNVTGSLHMGHAFQDTLMDALIRYHRMQGFRTLWQCGTDHAGIATQMVVERQLGLKGSSRHDLGRDRFVDAVWDWKAEAGGTLSQQLRRVGASMDWSRERFTMDDGLSAAVTEVFVRLHDEGLIYRGKRLVNWDPVLNTAISDLEVVATEEQGHLWHIRYPLEDGSGYVVVATTRPETLLGDAAVAVHPDDERYQALIGKRVALPLCDRTIPVIADTYVDPAFGSGCVKITPAHDFNDYAVGERHDLPKINIFTDNAAINDAAPAAYRGLDRVVARQRVVADLEALGLIDKIDPHKLMVPRGDRSQAVIEPYLTDQWFVRIAPLAGPAIACVEDGRIRFVPETGRKPILSGCGTSRTGASAASSGGGTASRPGMRRTAASTSAARSARRAPSQASAPTCRCGRTRTCWTPGFPAPCGPSLPSAGRRKRRSSRPSTRRACW